MLLIIGNKKFIITDKILQKVNRLKLLITLLKN